METDLSKQIEAAQGSVKYFIEEIKVWNDKNKEEVWKWTEKLEKAEEYGNTKAEERAQEELDSLKDKSDLDFLVQQRDEAAADLKKLKNEEKENKKRKAEEEETDLNIADTRAFVCRGIDASCRNIVESVGQQFKEQHLTFQTTVHKNRPTNHKQDCKCKGCFHLGCKCHKCTCGYYVDNWSTTQILEHMAYCPCYKSFKFLFDGREIDVPSHIHSTSTTVWSELSRAVHNAVHIAENASLVINHTLPDREKHLLIKLAQALGYSPLIMTIEGKVRRPVPKEFDSPIIKPRQIPKLD